MFGGDGGFCSADPTDPNYFYGEYVYLKKSYGETAAFLFGWQRFIVGGSASVASLGSGFAIFLAAIVGLARCVSYSPKHPVKLPAKDAEPAKPPLAVRAHEVFLGTARGEQP